jgi:hypothetical protein
MRIDRGGDLPLEMRLALEQPENKLKNAQWVEAKKKKNALDEHVRSDQRTVEVHSDDAPARVQSASVGYFT